VFSDTIPNLAGQRLAYLEVQLKALKDGSRKNPVMNAIAGQLNNDDIANVAAYFASLPGAAAAAAKSEFLPHLAKTNVAFPEGTRRLRKYHTINFPATKQVRYYYANEPALQAAKGGKTLPDGSVLFTEVWSAKLDADKKPVTGADGFYVADSVALLHRDGARHRLGQGHPRHAAQIENWNYAVFTTAKQLRPGVNRPSACLPQAARQGELQPSRSTAHRGRQEQVTVGAGGRRAVGLR